jgi:putative ABC transport system substrate-binding protein
VSLTVRQLAAGVWPLLAAFVGLFAAAPPGVDAQDTPRLYRVGALTEAWSASHPTVTGLKAGLKELGLEEGRHVTLDVRFTEGKPEGLPLAATALVKAGVDLIFTNSEASTQAAKTATDRLPIVFTLVGDPVAAGVVANLAHPGGNLTGVSSLTTELVGKRLEVLKTMFPAVRRVWAIYYGGDLTASEIVVKALDAAPRLGLDFVSRGVLTSEELLRALAEVRSGDALLAPDIDTLDIPAAILRVSLDSRIPAVFGTALWVGRGGVISYGPDYFAQGVQAARLVAKILRGGRPQDIPVEGARKIELAVNLKTVALFGATVPRRILVRADRLQR